MTSLVISPPLLTMSVSNPLTSMSSGNRLLAVVAKQEIERLKPQFLHRPALPSCNFVQHFFGQRVHVDGNSLQCLPALGNGIGQRLWCRSRLPPPHTRALSHSVAESRRGFPCDLGIGSFA